MNMGNALLYIAATSTYRTRVLPCVNVQRLFVCLFSWRYNPLWFSQPSSGL
jgi:hypothetical protein